MREFSQLINQLILTRSRNRKIELLNHYFKNIKNPDRGLALAILTGNLKIQNISISKIKEMIKEEVDSELFDLSYDYVGDLAETIALIWPFKQKGAVPKLNFIIDELESSSTTNISRLMKKYLSIFSENERWAFIKLLSGGLRIGVSTRLTKLSLIHNTNIKISEVEQIWHGVVPPYIKLFNWIFEKGNKPEIKIEKVFHPLMLAHPIEKNDFNNLKPEDFLAEWKWDGIRVQLVLFKSKIRIFSRTGDDISHTFPEIQNNENDLVVLDGELLVGNDFTPLKFNKLQQRLNRKKVSQVHLENFPAFVKLYDILFLKNRDLRNLSFSKRREILLDWHDKVQNKFFDLSEVFKFKTWEELTNIKSKKLNKSEHEGLMIKRKNSAYISGRQKGYWYKWKNEPLVVDAVMMYAQRGHGKRSSYYSDFTFGLWDKDNIVPICKAYFGFNNEELEILDKFVRNNTINKYGPVREVEKKFVVEIAFDSVDFSKRHKSGVALRFPRIKRLRQDKPIDEVINIKVFKENFINY